MKIKIYKITRCGDCPECDYIEYKGMSCKMMHMKVVDLNKIPDWCPLEDYKQDDGLLPL